MLMQTLCHLPAMLTSSASVTTVLAGTQTGCINTCKDAHTTQCQCFVPFSQEVLVPASRPNSHSCETARAPLEQLLHSFPPTMHSLSLVVIGLCVTLALAVPRPATMIMRPPPACPAFPVVEGPLPEGCGVECSSNGDCEPDSFCCDTECGTKSCRVVRASCTDENDQVVPFHQPMSFLTTDPDLCGNCWCQNGVRECVTWACGGPMP